MQVSGCLSKNVRQQTLKEKKVIINVEKRAIMKHAVETLTVNSIKCHFFNKKPLLFTIKTPPHEKTLPTKFQFLSLSNVTSTV